MSEVYIGIKPCGCVVAIVVNERDYPKDVANGVSKMIKKGYRIEAVGRDEAVKRLTDCKCAKANLDAARRERAGGRRG